MILLQCNDPILLPILSVMKNVFLMIQIIGPILSIVALTILMFKLLIDPVDKQDKIKHGIRNSVIALVVLFLIPLLVNITMALLGDTFSVSACWNSADNYKMSSGKYNSKNDKNKTKIINDKKYDDGGTGESSSGTGDEYTDINSENMADAFVKLAMAQKNSSSAVGGQKYWSYMGFKHHVHWCACFVSWVVQHTEHNGEKMTKYFDYKSGGCNNFVNYCKKKKGCTYHDGSNYTPKRGDIIVFTWNNRATVGHIGIVQYTKNGTIKTIEGNVSDKVRERSVKVGNKTIYGIISWS